MARRGFLAEMQHQARVNAQRQNAALRANQAAARKAEQAQRAAERAALAAQRASEADRKRLEREAVAAHVEAMQAEVDQKNTALSDEYEQIDGLLTATLAVDDFVDLETLRVAVQHPPFDREDLRVPVAAPIPVPDPPLPVKQAPEPPKGLFGRKKKEEEALAAAEAQYAADYYAWQAATEELPGRRERQAAEYATAEEARQKALATELARYEAECAERDQEAATQNASLDQLIAGLGYGTVDAVKEYVGIVLANSVYPEGIEVTHTEDFDPATAELSIRVLVPGPDKIPTIKAYRYTKATDEITSTSLTQKDQKDRYAGLINNVSLRTLHEVFEADRRGIIRGISLELGTETLNPATGRSIYVPFVAVATDRDKFQEIDLSAIVPAATLEYLGAAVSKNPFALTPITAGGVRRV